MATMATLNVTLVLPNLDELRRSVRKANDAFYELGQRLGLRDIRAEHINRRKQRDLRSHVMWINAGNRRRQMRSRGVQS